MEWEVWSTVGRFDSFRHTWDDVPAIGILVVRVWNGPLGDVVDWRSNSDIAYDQAYYGHPATWKMEGRLSDEEFAKVLAEAQSTIIPPSKR